ncbi:RNA polymerase I-specific transcription initiation factor RRN3 [Polyplosphaeria fusca]|uniref:RNA polymerase I-specific transcription initiation factor RRN3 n=1 Tax=Polyplosphaeria fusca TaxID=682080 RepID=A0A9P4R940_9PLEO|nr:RNA polymerase I-specific transcription initiation factor RRN3 [Polyplosphaeria fusca]
MVSLASTERAVGVIAPSVGGSLKRKHDDIALDADLSSSQIKKRRVTFDPDVDVHILSDVNEKSSELVEEEVRRALEKRANGDNAVYDSIRQLFALKPTSDDAPTTGVLHKYVVALSNNMLLLNQKCSGLVHAIIDTRWITRNEQFVRSYRHFIRSLLSVHPGYTSAVLGMLVELFLNLPSPALRHSEDSPVQRDQLQIRAHECLRYLLRQNPMTSTHLAPILSATFPPPEASVKEHTRYMENILKVQEYCPELKGEILSLIMEKLVKIDVEIQVDLDEMEDDIEDQLVEEAADEDDEEDLSDDESISSEESLEEASRQIEKVKGYISKLDATMDLLFSHYDSIFTGDMWDSDDTFDKLLSQFASIILPTYRSRHTQFLLFHFSQLSPDLTERFAGCCSHLAFDQRRPQILRIAAAAYLASFIARGSHVSASLVRNVFDLLCSHLEALRESHESTCKAPDLRRYGTYYAISQALLYTFCFRWRDLIITPDDSPVTDEDLIYADHDFRWHSHVQEILRKNIFSKLNPLKICAPTIVQQFARIAHHLRFLYVFPLIETNKRIKLTRSVGSYMDGVATRETALSMKRGDEAFLLDAYFPFDPYLLRKSRRWVEGDYVEWKPVPGMENPYAQDEDEDDEDEQDDGEDDDSSSSELEDEEDIDDATATDESLPGRAV